MSRVLFFPSSSSRASFSIARAHLFALAIFFHPLFLFNLRFKVVIFSRPPFFQPVLRFVSLLIFFFGRSCAFVFEVQGLPLLLAYFLPTSSSCTRISSSTLLFSFSIYLFHFFPNFSSRSFCCLSFPFHSCSSPLSLSNVSRSKNFTSFFLRILFHFLISFFFLDRAYIFKYFIVLFLYSISFMYLLSFLFVLSLNDSGLLFVFHFRPFLPPRNSSCFFLLPHIYVLLLGVSSLKCRALQAPQSHLVIQLSEVQEGEYPFSLSLRTLSAPSTCNHRGERSLQSERSEKCC